MHNKENYADDEISLSNLRKSISNSFRILFKVFDFLLSIITKNIRLFIIIPLICIALGLLFFYTRPKVYEQTMIVKFNELTRSTYYEIFNELNDLATSKSNNALAEELKIDPKISKQIKSIELRSLSSQSTEKDTNKLFEQPFLIILKTSENNYADILQNAILADFNNNKYLSKIKEDQKKIYSDKLLFINKELQKLDSLKDQYTKSLNAGKIAATFYNNAFNPTEAYIHSFTLVNQKETIEKWISENSNSIVLIDGFKKPNVAKTISLFKLVGLGFLIGFLFTYLISSIIEIKAVV